MRYNAILQSLMQQQQSAVSLYLIKESDSNLPENPSYVYQTLLIPQGNIIYNHSK